MFKYENRSGFSLCGKKVVKSTTKVVLLGRLLVRIPILSSFVNGLIHACMKVTVSVTVTDVY